MSATKSSPGQGGGGLQVYPAGLGPQTATPLLALQGQRGSVDSWLDMKMCLSGAGSTRGGHTSTALLPAALGFRVSPQVWHLPSSAVGRQ